MATSSASKYPGLDLSTLDLHSADFSSRYDSAVLELVHAGPVIWTNAHGGYWLVTGYDESVEVLTDVDRFSSDHIDEGARRGYGGVGMPPAQIQTGFLEMDPPEHQGRRRLFTSMFSSGSIKARESEISDVTTYFLDQVIEDGECDFVMQVASPVTAVMTMRLLGIPDTEWSLFAVAMHHRLSSAPGTADHELGLIEVGGVMQSLQNHLQARLLSDERHDDVIQRLKDARINGEPMDPAEMLLHLGLFYNAGVDTTANLLANTVNWLATHTVIRDKLKSDRSLIDVAFKEFLRVLNPVVGTARTVTVGTDLGGQVMQEGDRLFVVLGAANNDEAQFKCPAQLDIRRPSNRPLSFGMGTHRCIGAPLAESIFKNVLSQTLERMPDYQLGARGPITYPSFGVIRGMIELNIKFTPGPRRAHDGP